MLIKYPVNNILQKFRNTSYNTNNKKQVEFCIFQPRYYLWYITFYIIIFDIYIQISLSVHIYMLQNIVQFKPFTAIKNIPREKLVAFIKNPHKIKNSNKNIYFFLTLHVMDVNKNYLSGLTRKNKHIVTILQQYNKQYVRTTYHRNGQKRNFSRQIVIFLVKKRNFSRSKTKLFYLSKQIYI